MLDVWENDVHGRDTGSHQFLKQEIGGRHRGDLILLIRKTGMTIRAVVFDIGGVLETKMFSFFPRKEAHFCRNIPCSAEYFSAKSLVSRVK